VDALAVGKAQREGEAAARSSGERASFCRDRSCAHDSPVVRTQQERPAAGGHARPLNLPLGRPKRERRRRGPRGQRQSFDPGRPVWNLRADMLTAFNQI
jgi:hypothetical protein